ncbi:MAG: hypothetical protein HY842_05360 [Bacteroidetes bacterium]|nr:hypothetical protein [Bacteroidota bacterium]
MKKLLVRGSVLPPLSVKGKKFFLLIFSWLQIEIKKSVSGYFKVIYLAADFGGGKRPPSGCYHPMNIFPMKPIAVLLQTYLLFPAFVRQVVFSPPGIPVFSMNKNEADTMATGG